MHRLALIYLKIKDSKRHLKYYKTNITHLFYSKPIVNKMTAKPIDQEKAARQEEDETSQTGNLNDNCYLAGALLLAFSKILALSPSMIHGVSMLDVLLR